MLKTLSLATIGLAFALSSASACEWMEEKKQSVKAPSQPDIIASVLKPLGLHNVPSAPHSYAS